MKKRTRRPLSDSELLELKRWNTPTIYNGWEQITRHDSSHDAFNPEPTQDFMPRMGPMVGYAATVVIEPGNPAHPKANPRSWSEYRRYLAGLEGPVIAVVQDLDKPRVLGAFFGEVAGSFHRALGCVGGIIDGGIRDLDELNSVGFKVLARSLCVGHARSVPVRWGCEVEVFGRRIAPGQLIHADKHGFLAVPPGEERGLLEAARFMDANECRTVIPAGSGGRAKTRLQICDDLDRAGAAFQKAARAKFGKRGEW